MPSACDILLLGPDDPTRRLLAALLLAEGLGVVGTSDPFEARQANDRGLPRVVITYFPPGFDPLSLRQLLGTHLLDHAAFLSVEDATASGIEMLARRVRRFCNAAAPPTREAAIEATLLGDAPPDVPCV